MHPLKIRNQLTLRNEYGENSHGKSRGKGFVAMRGKKNEFRKDGGLGEFARTSAKFKCIL
jgi:hypothetical protein